MSFYPFGYHEAGHIVAPRQEDLHKNIKGLELEISDYGAHDYISNLVNDGIVIDEDTDGCFDKEYIAVERDGSVEWELIFQATSNRNLLRNLKDVNKQLNPHTVDNHQGTSAHIHLNREYLQKQGVFNIDLQKIGEFLAYPLYLFSGRNEHYMNEWARSQLPCELEDDLLTRAKFVDRLNNVSYNRYNIFNFNPTNTCELRIFSNYCDFDYKTIRLFLEVADLLIKGARFMEGKSYTENIDEIITFVDDYMRKYPRRNFIYEKYDMDSIFLSGEELRHISILKQWESINSRIRNFEHRIENQNHEENTLSFIRMVRDINSRQGLDLDWTINPVTIDFEDECMNIRNIIRRNLQLEE